MDADAELLFERRALAKADVDIDRGTERLRRQEAVLADLRARGCETDGAERLLALLGETLSQWRSHRELIVQRIDYLEVKTTPGGPDRPMLG